MNEQKEIRWWEEIRWWDEETYGVDDEGKLYAHCERGNMSIPEYIEAEVISRVELDARKDERERVLGEVEKFRNSYEGEDFDARVEAYTENSLLDKISTALKSLSGNNE